MQSPAMSDFGDEAQTAQERHLTSALARAGVKPRLVNIPPPHYVEADPVPVPCEPCGRQSDKGRV